MAHILRLSILELIADNEKTVEKIEHLPPEFKSMGSQELKPDKFRNTEIEMNEIRMKAKAFHNDPDRMEKLKNLRNIILKHIPDGASLTDELFRQRGHELDVELRP